MDSHLKAKALLLDRDGVINKEVGYLHRIQDFVFLPGAIETCRDYQAAGYLLIIVTNQAGIAHGYYSERDFHVLNDWMLQHFEKCGVRIDKVFFPHFIPKARGHTGRIVSVASRTRV